MNMLHKNKYHPICDDDDFELKNHKGINLYIFCLYLIAFGLLVNLIVFIYQNF